MAAAVPAERSMLERCRKRSGATGERVDRTFMHAKTNSHRVPSVLAGNDNGFFRFNPSP